MDGNEHLWERNDIQFAEGQVLCLSLTAVPLSPTETC